MPTKNLTEQLLEAMRESGLARNLHTASVKLREWRAELRDRVERGLVVGKGFYVG